MKFLEGVAAVAIAAAGGVYAMNNTTEVVGAEVHGESSYIWRASVGPSGEIDVTVRPLYEAIISNDLVETRRLLESGVSPNILLNPQGWSSVMVAIRLGHSEIVNELVNYGANLNYISKGPVEKTPLRVAMEAEIHYVVENGHRPDISNRLTNTILDKGADINLTYGYDTDIAIDAAILGQLEFVLELLSRGYNRDVPRLGEVLRLRAYDNEGEALRAEILRRIEGPPR